MEILDNFGLNPVLLGAQVVNFLIILFILRRFLYKPVLDLLKKREDTIKEGLEKAEENEKLLEKTKKEEETVLKNAQVQARKIIEEARAQALLLMKESQESAKKQSERLIEEARAQISQEASLIEQKIMGNIGKISIEMLGKALGGLTNEDAQEDIMKKAIKQLKKSN